MNDGGNVHSLEHPEKKSNTSEDGDVHDPAMIELMASTSHLFAPLPATAQPTAAPPVIDSVPKANVEAEEYYGASLGGQRTQRKRRDSTHDPPAFVQRLEQWEKKRNERLQQQRAEKERENSVDPECTFSPRRFSGTRETRSGSKGQNTGRPIDAVHRLYRWHAKKEKRRLDVQEAGRRDKECTFRPTITNLGHRASGVVARQFRVSPNPRDVEALAAVSPSLSARQRADLKAFVARQARAREREEAKKHVPHCTGSRYRGTVTEPEEFHLSHRDQTNRRRRDPPRVMLPRTQSPSSAQIRLVGGSSPSQLSPRGASSSSPYSHSQSPEHRRRSPGLPIADAWARFSAEVDATLTDEEPTTEPARFHSYSACDQQRDGIRIPRAEEPRPVRHSVDGPVAKYTSPDWLTHHHRREWAHVARIRRKSIDKHMLRMYGMSPTSGEW